MDLEIIKLQEETSLFCKFPGQQKQQDCYLELTEDGQVSCGYSGEIGNAVPISVYNRIDLRWQIPCLKARFANELMKEVTPLLLRVYNGMDSKWNGHNMMGYLSDDAHRAYEEIDKVISNYDHEFMLIC